MRPDAESVHNTIQYFRDNNLRDLDCDEFVFTWSGEECEKFKNNYNLKVVEYQKPQLEYIKTLISIDRFGNGCPVERPFWQYYMQKEATQFLYDQNKYDFVIMTRGDIDIISHPKIAAWFVKDKYSTFKSTCETFHTDMIGVSDPKTMKDAWDFETYEHLNELFKNAYRGEDPLCAMLKEKNIEINSVKHPVNCDGLFTFNTNPNRRINNPVREEIKK